MVNILKELDEHIQAYSEPAQRVLKGEIAHAKNGNDQASGLALIRVRNWITELLAQQDLDARIRKEAGAAQSQIRSLLGRNERKEPYDKHRLEDVRLLVRLLEDIAKHETLTPERAELLQKLDLLFHQRGRAATREAELAKALLKVEITFAKEHDPRPQQEMLKVIENRLLGMQKNTNKKARKRIETALNCITLLGELKHPGESTEHDKERMNCVKDIIAALDETPAKKRRRGWLRRFIAGGLLFGGLLGSQAVRAQHTSQPPEAAQVQQQMRQPFTQEGIATIYAGFFQGRTTSAGTRFDQGRVSAAVPLGSPLFNRAHPYRLRITNLDNGRTIVADAEDKGDFGYHKEKGDWVENKYATQDSVPRIVDLSMAAALKLGIITPTEFRDAEKDGFRVNIRRSAHVRVTLVAPPQAQSIVKAESVGDPAQVL